MPPGSGMNPAHAARTCERVDRWWSTSVLNRARRGWVAS